MWSLLTRTVLRNTVVRAVARAAGTAAISAFAWKLGADTYEGLKRRLRRREAEAEDSAES